jgi:mono/diheme cytochrome c family protein
MTPRRWRLGALLLILSAAGCKGQVPFTQAQKLGGQDIPAAVLNEGHEAYLRYCYACHGDKGDGNGPAAPTMRPPPRDLGSGVFKFAGVAAGELPNDDDLESLIRRGLLGTPMLPWDIGDRERHAIVQYLKTFSPRWKTEAPGDRIEPDGADPWKGKEAEAAAAGEVIYHLTGVQIDPATNAPKMVLAGCNACHPSYLPTAQLQALSQKLLGKPFEAREDPYRPALKESEYQVGRPGDPGRLKLQILPTDFLYHPIKNGTEPLALFRTIAAGVGGTAMPTWKGSLKDADLWALVHYVRRLAALRDTPGAAALQRQLTGK